MKDRLLLTFLFVCIISMSYGQKPKFKKVSKEELTKTVCEYDSTANAEYLYHGCSVEFEYNRTKSSFDVNYYYHQRIKIYNEKGIYLANQVLNYFQVDNNTVSERIVNLEAYTFNIENGKIEKTKLEKENIYEEEVNKYIGSKRFAMPAIKKGSVLDIKYKISSPFYFKMRQFYFQKDEPVKYTEYKVAIPEYFNYNYNLNGLVFLDVDESESSGTIQFSQSRDLSTINRKTRHTQMNFKNIVKEYTASNVASIKEEPNVYSMNNFKSSIQLELLSTQYPYSEIKYYTNTWNDIATLLDNNVSFGDQLRKRYRKMDALVAEVDTMEEAEKIATIYHRIQQQFTWNTYSGCTTEKGIKKLIKEGTGNTADINLLLVKVLQKAGLNAFPMVCKRRKSGYLSVTNPTLAELDNVVAIVINGEKVIYLDATDKLAVPDLLPPSILNLRGVVIKDKEGQAIPFDNHNKGSDNKVYTMSFEGGDLVGTYKQIVKGYTAYLYRTLYSKSEEILTQVGTDKVLISNSEVKDFTNLSKPISVFSDIKIKGYTQEIDNKIFIDLLVGQDKFINSYQSEERKFALFFDSKYSGTKLIKVEIPEGYQVESIPEILNASCEGGAIKYMIKPQVVGSEIMITIRHQIKKTIVSPEYYKSIKTLYEIVEAKTKEKIVLSKI